MLKSKKSVALLVALSLIISTLLTGFTVKSAEPKVDYKKLKPVELTWYFVGDKQPDENQVYAAMNKIIKVKINATVNFKRIDWASYEEKTKLAMASGQEWDIMFTSTWMNNFYTAVAKGAFLDITDLIKKFPVLLKSVPEFCLSSGTYNGKQYAIPNYQAMYIQWGLAVPTNIAKSVGLDKVKRFNSTSELEPYLAKLKAAYPDRITIDGNSFISKNYDQVAGLLDIYYKNDDKSRKVFQGLKDPAFVADARTNREWFLKGYYRPDLLTFVNGTITSKMLAQQYCVLWQPVLKPGQESELLAQYGVPMTAIPIMDPFIRANGGASTMNAINKNSKNPERALAFMELMNSDPLTYNTMCFGIQYKHYNKVSANRIKQIDNKKYAPNLAWEYGNQFNAWYYGTQPDGIWAKTDKLNRTAVNSVLNGFASDLTNIKDKIAQCDAVYKEYEKLTSGAMDFEKYLPEYLEKRKKAGIEDVIAELQKQVDAWAKTQK